MLPTPFTDQDLTGWLVAEKYDGVRAWWSGSALTLTNGTVIVAPGWFTSNWPRIELDGELWAGRGQLAKVQAAIVDAKHAAWSDEHGMRFIVWDAPGAGSLAKRLTRLQPQIVGVPHIFNAGFRVAKSTAHAKQLCRNCIAQFGEGIVAKNPASHYIGGKSADWLTMTGENV